MEKKDYAAALDAAEKSLAQKERGKPLEPKRLEFCGCMVGPNDPDPKCHSCLGSGNPTYGSRIEALEFELRATKIELQVADEQIERLQNYARSKGIHNTPPSRVGVHNLDWGSSSPDAVIAPDDIHDLKARLNVLVPAMEQIAAIAQGSTSTNSLPNIARIASLALHCQEPF